jgi:hypothetical protein
MKHELQPSAFFRSLHHLHQFLLKVFPTPLPPSLTMGTPNNPGPGDHHRADPASVSQSDALVLIEIKDMSPPQVCSCSSLPDSRTLTIPQRRSSVDSLESDTGSERSSSTDSDDGSTTIRGTLSSDDEDCWSSDDDSDDGGSPESESDSDDESDTPTPTARSGIISFGTDAQPCEQLRDGGAKARARKELDKDGDRVAHSPISETPLDAEASASDLGGEVTSAETTLYGSRPLWGTFPRAQKCTGALARRPRRRSH